LARRVDVSASLISQIELGKATPSVGTLYAIVTELGMSLDKLFFDAAGGGETSAQGDFSHPPAHDMEPVVRRADRKAIQLESGVRWERLTPATEHDVDFLYVRYDVGGASCRPDSLMRHAGKEYGHVLEGRLGVTVGFETYELDPGDAISFSSDLPHRLFNAGDLLVEAIWFVLGRRGEAQVTRGNGHRP
jgi:transcriptional regulator with XRE-family HTH domain